MKTCTPNKTLTNLDQRSALGFIRINEMLELYGCSRATLWRWVKSGKVPAPKKLGERITAWQVGEIREALKSIGES